MRASPISIPHSIAEYYHRDARDFARRFDLLWETELHKTGRIKSFVDLFMGIECALKCRVFLSRIDEDPEATYKKVRRAGHDIEKLSVLDKLESITLIRNLIRTDLSQFSVLIRYSLDAYAVFFPALSEMSSASIIYSRTIGDNAWVLRVRACLEDLNNFSSDEFSGIVGPDIEEIIEHERQLEQFVLNISPRAKLKPASS